MTRTLCAPCLIGACFFPAIRRHTHMNAEDVAEAYLLPPNPETLITDHPCECFCSIGMEAFVRLGLKDVSTVETRGGVVIPLRRKDQS